MRISTTLFLTALVWTRVASAADDWIDRADQALTITGFDEAARARLSGTLDLEGYDLSQPAPGLIHTSGNHLFNPRLTLFLDAQAGPHVYVFAQARADRGFDPSDDRGRMRLDEYAVRFTPWTDGRFDLQIGKFATVVGNWVARHNSWENPFITPPLPYENLTGMWDVVAPDSADTLMKWAHVRPRPFTGYDDADRYKRLPVIWGPSYTRGVSVSGASGIFEYAAEWKNGALSSRPGVWAQQNWNHPTVSGRIGVRPSPAWNFGFSASDGAYLRASAAPTLAPGRSLGDYREQVLGQDISYAWHHVQLWAEAYEAQFKIPRVGDARTLAYYVEGKYKFTPRFFAALRWNQQYFGELTDSLGVRSRWGRDVWRVDFAPTFRFTPHVQAKLQYSLQHQDLAPTVYGHVFAGQVTLRF